MLQISTRAAEAILREAERAGPREACGLLLGQGLRVSHVVPASNVAVDPARAFEINPATLLAAHRRARGGGPAIIGCYHSHPSGSPVPSPRDAAATTSAMPVWIIAAAGELGYWLVRDGGPVAGRFEAVDRLLTSGCTQGLPSPQANDPPTPQGDDPFDSLRICP